MAPPRWIELLPSPDGSFAPPRPPAGSRYGLALALFALTFLTTTTYGALMVVMSRTDLFVAVDPLDPVAIASLVWKSRQLLALGLAFSLSALTILLAHELGHYVACRRYGLPCTLPYFLPVPLNFGTFGAFIRIQAPIRTKSELFDVGIAGPIAGFVTLIPFLIYGLAHSSYAGSGLGGDLTQLGHPLAIELVARLLHGPPPAGAFLNLHPAALGAWLGLLATSINLLPLGQLDGGHVLYAVLGARQRRLARPLWLALALLGFIWPGWWVWCVLLLVIGIRHPPVYDETAPLDRKRKLLGGLALVMLVLSFTPAPVAITRLGEPVPSLPQAPRQRALPAVDSPAGARADLEDQGHRPVVDQGHRHPGAKAPGRDA